MMSDTVRLVWPADWPVRSFEGDTIPKVNYDAYVKRLQANVEACEKILGKLPNRDLNLIALTVATQMRYENEQDATTRLNL